MEPSDDDQGSVLEKKVTNPDSSWSRVELRSLEALDAYCLKQHPLPFDIWRCKTDVSENFLSKSAAVLSEAEQQRAGKFRSNPDRRRYLVSHLLLRGVLSQYRDITPASWHFTANEFGRPEIEPVLAARLNRSTGSSGLRFNLSRSGDMTVCAVARCGAIGIDIEDEIVDIPSQELAKEVLSSNEFARWHRLKTEERNSTFLKYWVLKEAYLKARGIGLAVDLSGIAFNGVGSPKIEVQAPTFSESGEECWCFHLLQFCQRYHLAVAYRQNPC